MLRGELAVDDEVVDRAAVGVEHHPVQGLAGLSEGDVVGEDMIYEGFSPGAADEDFAHVGHIENSGFGADCHMFLGDAGILDGHIEAGEGAHLGAKRDMTVVQASQFKVFVHNVGFSVYVVSNLMIFSISSAES